MNKSWKVFFCDSSIEQCPVTDFVQTCKKEHQVKLLHFINLLEEIGPNLKRPYADLLDYGVHELRVKLSGEQVRFFYFFCFEKYIILFSVFRKNTDKIPVNYIIDTYHYKKEILENIEPSKFELLNRNNNIYILKDKLNDSSFKITYDRECNVCKKTVEILNKLSIKENGTDSFTRKTGISLELLNKFKDADYCSYDLVERLCTDLDIDVPENCPKR
jgi:hypothetical protein